MSGSLKKNIWNSGVLNNNEMWDVSVCRSPMICARGLITCLPFKMWDAGEG